MRLVLPANGPIGWTLDQCKTKYGNAEHIPRTSDFTAGENYRFHVAGFWITVNIIDGMVTAVMYEPENPITRDQAKQILTKNASTTWKNDELFDYDEDMNIIKTKDSRSHNLSAALHLISRNHTIWRLMIHDDTILDPIRNRIEAAKQEKKDKEVKEVQRKVDNL